MFGRFVHGPPKLLCGPCVGGGIGNQALGGLGEGFCLLGKS